ncbi:MAG: hypothetical protein ACI9TV_003274, partial [Sulfurimonas sp.]|uniref:hypothetical protein n=1 Tax=Sulfurimonas sp. TaxID=2022749 RepID=UPI0039E6CA90
MHSIKHDEIARPKITHVSSNITFNDIVYIYLNDKNMNKSNNGTKLRYIKHLKDVIGNKSIELISHENISAIQKALMINYKNATVNHIILFVTTVYKHYKKVSVTSEKHNIYKGSIPTSAISMLKLDNVRDRYLKKVEIDELLE